MSFPRGGIRLNGLLLCAAIGLAARALCAEVVTIESRAPGQGHEWYSDSGMHDSSAKSCAVGLTSGIGSRFGSEGTPSFTISPPLACPPATYEVAITKTQQNQNASPDILVAISQTGGSGLPATTTAFRRDSGTGTTCPVTDGWVRIGYFTRDPGAAVASITFTYQSGTLAPQGGRFYADAVRLRTFCPIVPAYADLDQDCDVDQADAVCFIACVSGPMIHPDDPACLAADFDFDGDIDQSDFGLFQRCFGGPGLPVPLDCR